MKKIMCAIGLASILWTVKTVTGQEAPGLIAPSRLNTFIENVMETAHISGLSASVIVGDQVVWKGNFGMADRGRGFPVTDSTLFLLYSVSKPVTGYALMQLEEAGLVDLDAPIENYLSFPVVHPDFPDSIITLRMLMSHVSGIRDNFGVINSLNVFGRDPEVALDSFMVQYLVPGGIWYGSNTSYTNYAPGTHFEYSNVGASLVGKIVESVTESCLDDYCRNHLFNVLDMPRASYRFSSLDTDLMAMPYIHNGIDFIPAGHQNNPLYPAGFLRTSREQLDHFLLSLLQNGLYNGNRVIDSLSVQHMITPHYAAIEPNSGLMMGFEQGNKVWGHAGGSSGVKTAMFFNPDEKWGINLLSNGGGEPWQIIFMLYQFAREYQHLSIDHLSVSGENTNGIIDPGEKVAIHGIIRNNSMLDFSQMKVMVHTHDNDIIFSVDSLIIDQISPDDSIEHHQHPFVFTVSNQCLPHATTLYFDFFQDSHLVARDSIELYLGKAHLLLVDDEINYYRNMVHTAGFFKSSLSTVEIRVNYLDLNKWVLPDSATFAAHDALIWFTGLSQGNLLNNMESNLIKGFLQGGGKLFMTGQNIAGDTLAAPFLSEYLHVSGTGTWNGNRSVKGFEGTILGNGLQFSIEGGTGSGTQVNPRMLIPVNNGESVFHYATDTGSVAAISYSGTYKSFFMGFGFEGISEKEQRDSLMTRIIRWFGPFSGKPETERIEMDQSPFELYPIPFQRCINIVSENDVHGPVDVTLFDNMGRTLFEQFFPVIKTPVSIDPGIIRQGIYFIRIRCGGNTFYKKIFKVN